MLGVGWIYCIVPGGNFPGEIWVIVPQASQQQLSCSTYFSTFTDLLQMGFLFLLVVCCVFVVVAAVPSSWLTGR